MTARRLMAGIALTAGVAAMVAGPAAAHTTVKTSTPAHGATVKTLPRTATLIFHGPLNRVVSVRTTRNGAGNLTTRARLHPRLANRVTVNLRPVARRNQPGRYQMRWTAVGADGHTIRGVVAFRVAR